MNEQHSLLRYPQERADYIAGVIVAVGLGMVLLGPLTLGIGYYLSRWLIRTRRAWRSYATLVSATGVALIYAYALLPLIVEQYSNFLNGLASGGDAGSLVGEYILPVWVWCVPLAPGVTLMSELAKWLKPKSVDEESQIREERIKAEREKLSQYAGKEAHKGTDEKLLQLGEFQKGDFFEQGIHNLYVHNGKLTLDRTIFNQHWLVIGTSGAGKTWSLLRLIWELLSKTDVDVYFVDGKGENPTAEAFRAMGYKARGEVPVFRLGHDKLGSRYNGFKGSKMAIYERLGAMINLGDPRNDPHWEATMDELLELMCCINHPEFDAPRSFEEVLERLNRTWLEGAYADNLYELQVLEDYNNKDMQGYMRRLRSTIRKLIQVTGDDGFALEDTRAAIFSIKTMAFRQTGSTFLKFLVEDLTDFIGNRQQRPAIMIIDEFGAFGNENIVKVLSMARSAELGVILATQNPASLGDEITKKLILGSTGTQLLMRSNEPEEIVNLAGTIMRPEVTTHYEDGQVVSKGGVRMQHQYKIDNNEVRGLLAGEGFIIRMGDRAKLTVSEITEKEWKKIGTPPPEVITPKPAQNRAQPEPRVKQRPAEQGQTKRHRDPDLLP